MLNNPLVLLLLLLSILVTYLPPIKIGPGWPSTAPPPQSQLTPQQPPQQGQYSEHGTLHMPDLFQLGLAGHTPITATLDLSHVQGTGNLQAPAGLVSSAVDAGLAVFTQSATSHTIHLKRTNSAPSTCLHSPNDCLLLHFTVKRSEGQAIVDNCASCSYYYYEYSQYFIHYTGW